MEKKKEKQLAQPRTKSPPSKYIQPKNASPLPSWCFCKPIQVLQSMHAWTDYGKTYTAIQIQISTQPEFQSQNSQRRTELNDALSRSLRYDLLQETLSPAIRYSPKTTG